MTRTNTSSKERLNYLVASERDQSWGLTITTIGFQTSPAGSVYPPKGHPSSYWFNPDKGRILQEFQLIFVVNGEGEFESSEVKHKKVKAGHVILLFPDEWHTFRPVKSEGWQVYWLGFKGTYAESLINQSFFTKPDASFEIEFNEQIISIFEQGIEIAYHQRRGYQQMLAGIANYLLSYIFYSRKTDSLKDREIVRKIDEARMIMTTNVMEPVKPEEIAAKLNLSYTWFRRVFKQYTGFSPAQYQMELKLQKSKELLTSTTMAIKEIAYELNFESISYFVTFFKLRTGISPNAYRKMVHGD